MKHFVDPWSVPHFLFGVVVALGAEAFGVPTIPAVLALLVVAIGWELFEWRIRLRESLRNSLTDVALPLVAFGAVLITVDPARLGQDRIAGLFVATTVIYALTNAVAWRARWRGERGFTS